MFRKYLLVLTAIVICITTLAVYELAARDIKAPWEQLTLLPNGDIWSFAELNDAVFVAVKGTGVFKSDDRGAHWTKLQNFSLTQVWELHVHKNYLFAAGAGGLYRSADGGDTWDDASSGIVKSSFWQVFAIETENDLLFTTTTNGFYTSDDQGLTWTNVERSLPTGDFLNIGISETTIFLGDLNKIVKYSRQSGSWTYIIMPFQRPNCSAYINGKLYAASSAGEAVQGLWRSDNNGDTWEQVDGGLPSGTIVNEIVFLGDEYLLATNRGLFTSPSGNNWSSVAPSTNGIDIYRLLPMDGDILLGTRGHGVYQLRRSTNSLSRVNSGIDYWRVLNLWLTDSRIFASSVFIELHQKNFGIAGEWQPTDPAFDLDQGVNDIKQNGEEILLGTNSLFRSLDNGNTWAEHPAVDNWGAVHSILPLDGVTMCFTDTHVYTINNIGLVASVAYEFESSVSASVLHKGVLFVGTDNSGNFRSDDGGQTWESVSNGMLNANTLTFLSDGDVLLSGTAKGVYRSVDMGESWQNVSGGNTINSSPIIGFGMLDDVMYMGTQFNLWFSTDQGVNWQPLSLEGLPESTWMSSLAMQDDQLYLGTHRIGMFTAQIQDKPTDVAGSGGPRNSVIGDLVVQLLHDGRHVGLSFSMDVDATAEYGVYDLRGQRLTAGRTAHLNSGRQSLTLELPNLAAGVYLCTLRIGEELVTRSFVVGP